MDSLSKQLYSCVSSAIEQFISKASSELDIEKEKLLEIWNGSVSAELKVSSISVVPSTSRRTISKQDPNAKQCIHIGTRGKTKGEQCTTKACPESVKGYCKKHMKGESSSPKSEKKPTASVVTNKTLSTPAVNTIKVESLPIKVNKFGNYQNASGIVFDRSTHEAYGRQLPEGKVVPLTVDDIRDCKQYGYKYRMPEQLKNKDEEDVEEVEEVEEEVEEVEEEEEDN